MIQFLDIKSFQRYSPVSIQLSKLLSLVAKFFYSYTGNDINLGFVGLSTRPSISDRLPVCVPVRLSWSECLLVFNEFTEIRMVDWFQCDNIPNDYLIPSKFCIDVRLPESTSTANIINAELMR